MLLSICKMSGRKLSNAMGHNACSGVAVVIPVRNGQALVRDAIASVRDQGPIVVELVVVDNGSIDDTAKLVSADGVRVVFEPRLGAGAARRAGLKATTAEVVMFLDHDDLLVPGAIDALLEALLRERADLAHGGLRNEAMPGLKTRVRFPEGVLSAPLTSSTIVRRDVFDRFGTFADDNYSWPAWIMAVKDAGARLAVIPGLVCIRRIHGANVTLTSNTYGPYFDMIRARLRSRSEKR